MKLLDLYRSILKTAHLIVDAEGFVSQVRGANKEPFLVDGQRLVLPTDEQMRAGEADTVAFHVLFEYLTRGESPVLAHDGCQFPANARTTLAGASGVSYVCARR
jgi:hypothetical protein